jgi:hypothetical protein
MNKLLNAITMKRLIITKVCFLFVLNLVFSQVEFGIKGGLHSLDLAKESIMLIGADEDRQLNLLESDFGFQFGLFTRIKIFGLYIEPSAMLHTTSVNYTLEEIGSNGIANSVLNERFTNLDIPVLLGFKLLLFKAFVGPVAHLNINSSSDLIDINGYSQRFEKATYGFQAGLGFDIWKLRLEAKYEGNLSKFGDHMIFGNQNVSFDERPSRVIVNIGFRF